MNAGHRRCAETLGCAAYVVADINEAGSQERTDTARGTFTAIVGMLSSGKRMRTPSAPRNLVSRADRSTARPFLAKLSVDGQLQRRGRAWAESLDDPADRGAWQPHAWLHRPAREAG